MVAGGRPFAARLPVSAGVATATPLGGDSADRGAGGVVAGAAVAHGAPTTVVGVATAAANGQATADGSVLVVGGVADNVGGVRGVLLGARGRTPAARFPATAAAVAAAASDVAATDRDGGGAVAAPAGHDGGALAVTGGAMVADDRRATADGPTLAGAVADLVGGGWEVLLSGGDGPSAARPPPHRC